MDNNKLVKSEIKIPGLLLYKPGIWILIFISPAAFCVFGHDRLR